MYSPKISERLIPILYRLAQSRKMPMTRLVDELLHKALSKEITKDLLKGDPHEEKRNKG